MRELHDEVLKMHVITPAKGPFMDCLAGYERVPSAIVVLGNVEYCEVCGNELGRTDQMRIRVWLDDHHEEACYAFLNVAPTHRR